MNWRTVTRTGHLSTVMIANPAPSTAAGLKGETMTSVCAICEEEGPDMECEPVVHPHWANELVHEDCLREWEREANDELCRELQAHISAGGAESEL